MQSLLGTLNYYENELGAAGKPAFRQLDSTVRRDLMTGWGFPLPPKRATQQDIEYRRTVLAKIPLERLYSWEVDLEKGFDLLDKRESQRTPARSHIRKFYTWCIHRNILVDPAQHEQTIKKTPAFNLKRRPKTRRKPCSLTPYALREKDLPFQLKAQIDHYIQYLTQRRVKGRQKKRIRRATGQSHQKILREILGWFHNEQGVPLADLSLDTIVTPSDLQDTQAAEAAAEYLRDWVDELALFLQQRGNSAMSIAKKISCLTRLIQYQPRGQYLDRHGNDIPVMKVARELITLYEDYGKDELDPLMLEGKWLELPDFIQKVTMATFPLTEFKTRHKHMRSPAAIADSFQNALLCSVLSLMAPRRPGEWRTCKVARACVLLEKPRDLEPGDWI
jgi:hypothetical protein